MKNKVKIMIVTMLACLLTVNMVCSSSFAANYAQKTGSKSLPSSYGSLKGKVMGFDSGVGRNFASFANTGKKVTKIRAKLTVQYYKSGNNIGPGDTSGWNRNAKSAHTDDYDLHHWTNKEKKTDGYFKNTVCVGYGTADAIIEKAYAVYTKVKY